MTRKIVIGDIHGCYDELLDLLDRIGPSEDDLLIPVGDIVDRGPKSVQVFDFFQSRKNAVVLMGNHERKHVRDVLSLSQKITRSQFDRNYTKARSWMSTLPYFYEDNDVIVVHAALQPDVSMKDQQEEILCGTMSGERRLKLLLNGEKWFEVYNGTKPVIFGHKVVGQTPLICNGKTFGIDTGACHGGWLTAITVPKFRIYSVKTQQNYWSRIKHEWRFEDLAAGE
jgi:serine/threonine protein phosphatase 1